MKYTNLPDEWCIKITEENIKVLGEWRDCGTFASPKTCIGGFCLCTDTDDLGYYISSFNPQKDTYKEITFEQFKMHVLKETYEIY